MGDDDANGIDVIAVTLGPSVGTAPAFTSSNRAGQNPFGMWWPGKVSYAQCIELVIKITNSAGTDITDTITWTWDSSSGTGIDLVACVDAFGNIVSITDLTPNEVSGSPRSAGLAILAALT